MPSPLRHRAVVFDLFDTLTVPYDDADFTAALGAMAQAVGATPAAFAEVWDRNWPRLLHGAFADTIAAVRAACQDLGLAASPAQADAAGAAWTAHLGRAIALRPEALPTLRAVRGAGRRIGLISDCAPGVPLLWRQMPVASLVDVAVFSCAVRLTKPARAIYLQACAGLGLSPQECLYVADGVGRELTGAAEVGMTAVLLRPPGPPPDDYRLDAQQWRGDCVSSILELPALLR